MFQHINFGGTLIIYSNPYIQFVTTSINSACNMSGESPPENKYTLWLTYVEFHFSVGGVGTSKERVEVIKDRKSLRARALTHQSLLHKGKKSMAARDFVKPSRIHYLDHLSPW